MKRRDSNNRRPKTVLWSPLTTEEPQAGAVNNDGDAAPATTRAELSVGGRSGSIMTSSRHAPSDVPINASFLSSVATNSPTRTSPLSKHSAYHPTSTDSDHSEIQPPTTRSVGDTSAIVFLRECKVVHDTLSHLVESENGFDDVLFLKCEEFLSAHEDGLALRRLAKEKEELEQQRRAKLVEKKNWVRKMTQLMEDPRSSKGAYTIFLTIALLVLLSCVTTLCSTLPSYNPMVVPHYSNMWNSLELTLGVIFTIETGVRMVLAIIDDSMPTAWWQNLFRFLTKPSNVVDIASIMPTYIQMFVSKNSRVIMGNLRTIRLLRLFKILRYYKPVRMLQKALRFSAKALIAPLLFFFTSLILVSSATYFSERGSYNGTSHKFETEQSPICIYEPAYFLTPFERLPYKNWSSILTHSPVVTPVPVSIPLPPPEGGDDAPSFGSSSSLSAGSHIANSLDGITMSFTCPDAQAKFVTIPQTGWWAIATMSTCGFGDFVTVTAAGHVVTVVAIIAGVILNAMPIAVIDASFVAVIATENDQESREAQRKKEEETSMRQALFQRNGEEIDDEALAASQILFDNSVLMPQQGSPSSTPSGSVNVSKESGNDLSSALLGVNQSFVTKSIMDEEDLIRRHDVASSTPKSHAEYFLVQLMQLCKHQCIDLANPTDEVLMITDKLLEAAVTNVAVAVALDRNAQEKETTASVWGQGSSSVERVASWVPSPMSRLHLWYLTTRTNLAREAQAAGLSMIPPTGEQREHVEETYLLSRPVRWAVGSTGSFLRMFFGTGKSYRHGAIFDESVSRELQAHWYEKFGSLYGGYYASLGLPVPPPPSPFLTTTRGSPQLQQAQQKYASSSRSQFRKQSVEDDTGIVQVLPTTPDSGRLSEGEELSQGEVMPPPLHQKGGRTVTIREDTTEDIEMTSPKSPAPKAGAKKAVPPSLSLNNVLHEHFFIVHYQSWGRCLSALIPRRPPSTALDGSNEVEAITVQIFRHSAKRNRWYTLIPFLSSHIDNSVQIKSVTKRWRSRVGKHLNVLLAPSAMLPVSSKEHLQTTVPKNVTLSAFAQKRLSKKLLAELRNQPQHPSSKVLSQRTTRPENTDEETTGVGMDAAQLDEKSRIKEREETRRARAAKAKKDAETRELLDALSDEKSRTMNEALQSLQLVEVTGMAMSNRLSLLKLAAAAAEKLELERAAEEELARRRFASVDRICSEEQEQRILLQPNDVIAVFGGCTTSPIEVCRHILAKLPNPKGLEKHVLRGSHAPQEDTTSVLKDVDALVTGAQTEGVLLYLFSTPTAA